jgi:peptide/nickel transport system permease protein
LSERESLSLPGWRNALQTLTWIIKNKPLGALGAVILVFWILVAIFAVQIAPHDPNQQGWRPLQPPSGEHLMGTDGYGRDVFSRVVYGARISLVVGLSTIVVSVALSLVIGVPSGFWGGPADTFVQRAVDILMSFPSLLFAMLLTVILGQSLRNVLIAIAFIQTVHGTRLVRSLVLAEREKEYVTASRVIGCRTTRVCFRHMVPNIFPLIIVAAAGGVGDAILAEASLSFLGLGVPPPAPSWGGALSRDARSYFMIAPWLALFPGLALSSTVLASNVFGDALRDALDPYLRRGRGV